MITVHHVVWALLNSIWQSAALAAIVFALMKVMPRSTAVQRYATWCAVLAAAALLPFANFALPRVIQPRQVHISTAPLPAERLTLVPRILHLSPTQHVTRLAEGEADRTALSSAFETQQTRPSVLGSLSAALLSGRYDFALILGWLVIANLLILRLVLGYATLARLKKTLAFRPLTEREQGACRTLTSRPVAVGYSSSVREPCVLGFAEPVIALPFDLALRFTTQDADRVIRHECAHIGRWDDYANLVKQILLAVLCFNPVVHALAKALDLEREIACDDAAASAQAERADFARCLCDIALLNTGRNWLPTAGLARNKQQLFVRIKRLLDRNHASSTHLNALARASMAAVVLAVVPFALLQFMTIDPAHASLTSAASSVATACPIKASVHVATVQKPARSQPQASPKTARIIVKVVSTATNARPVLAHVPPVAALHVAVRVPALMVRARVLEAIPVRAVVHMSFANVQMLRSLSRLGPIAFVHPEHGATSQHDDFLDALRESGFRTLSVDDIIAICDAGVQPSFLRELHAVGLTSIPARDLIALANAGVDAHFLAGLREARYSDLRTTDVIELANSGVNPHYLMALGMLGYHNLSVNEILRLSDSGVTPEFVARLQKSGVASGHQLSIDDLIRLSNAGI